MAARKGRYEKVLVGHDVLVPPRHPELHAETFVIKERYDCAQDGWYAYSINGVPARPGPAPAAGARGSATRADGRVAWEVADAARIGAEEASAVGGYERARLALEGG